MLCLCVSSSNVLDFAKIWPSSQLETTTATVDVDDVYFERKLFLNIFSFSYLKFSVGSEKEMRQFVRQFRLGVSRKIDVKTEKPLEIFRYSVVLLRRVVIWKLKEKCIQNAFIVVAPFSDANEEKRRKTLNVNIYFVDMWLRRSTFVIVAKCQRETFYFIADADTTMLSKKNFWRICRRLTCTFSRLVSYRQLRDYANNSILSNE